jgi:O-antigen/teichoic acid export membrane protein
VFAILRSQVVALANNPSEGLFPSSRTRLLQQEPAMGGVRRAFVWATTGRYVVMAINLSVAVAIARLIEPAAFGVSVLGSSAYAIAEALRELGGGAYLIQQDELSLEKIRTSITTSLLLSVAIALCLYLGAGPVARFYGLPEVEHYIRVTAFGYVLGPFIFPVFALMSREMAFNFHALVTVSMAFVGGLTSIGLAALGFGYMSFAWATVVSAGVGSGLCFLLRADLSIYRLSLSEWRGVIGFGAFDSATALIAALGEYAPYLVLGKVLDPASVGMAQRAVLLSLFPERVILAGVGAVALPIFARSVRENSDTKGAYITAIELITAVQWPCLILLGVLATPLISVLLGRQWHEVAPLLRILCLATAFSFPWALQYPVLVAVGAVRVLPRLVASQALLNTLAVGLTARYGLQAVAWGLVVTVPVNAFAAVALVRRHLRFHWFEFIGALCKSAGLTFMSSLGPIAVIVAEGGPSNLSIEGALIAAFLSALGWSAGLWLTRHPLRHELVRASKVIRGALRVRGGYSV